MKVAIYSRKSKYSGKGESIQSQIDLCKEYANKHYNIDKFIIYEDEGFSGGSSDRPNYKAMINDAKKGIFDILMCYRLDRISRSIADFSDTIELLKSNDISFISLREQFDTSTPIGRAMMYIASVFAQLERETIAERIRDNMLSLSRSGRWLGGNTPTGYTSKPIIYYDNNMNKKTMYKLKQVPKELFIVKKLFEKYLELGSLNQVETWTINNNFKTTNRNYFNVSSIRGILTNMVYVKADKTVYDYCNDLGMDIASDISEFDGVHGLMVYNKNIIRKGHANKLRPTCEWIVAVGKHKGIISSNKFIEVQKNIKKNRYSYKRRTTNNIALLSSMIVCGNCNSKLRTNYGNKRKDGTRLHYYKCILKEKSRNKKCNMKNLNGTIIDNLVLSEVKNLSIDYNRLYIYLEKQKKDLYSICSQDSKSLESKIKKYRDKIHSLTMNLSADVNSVSNKYIIEQIENLDIKIMSLKKQLDNLNSTNKISDNHISHIRFCIDLIKNPSESIYDLNFNERKHILNTVINNIYFNENCIKVTI